MVLESMGFIALTRVKGELLSPSRFRRVLSFIHRVQYLYILCIHREEPSKQKERKRYEHVGVHCNES